MAVGPRRDKIRDVALADLALVSIVFRPHVGKMLWSYKIDRTTGSVSARVSTFLESGEDDKLKAPWTPRAAESVRQLIETTRS